MSSSPPPSNPLSLPSDVTLASSLSLLSSYAPLFPPSLISAWLSSSGRHYDDPRVGKAVGARMDEMLVDVCARAKDERRRRLAEEGDEGGGGGGGGG
eukprot:CAMPEP_0182462274 /NCGR_PEP_ID=MMETSP1319-20130603/6598_1 /TAXON_ID=172717 /ORGANISM="Bolidomonas pacifica, Strain RCC208" /LENGTH=96 /DNA_ID=CAMNT_0024661687 /DNA_START=197 /DNA_END=483 /DNA_ORIENTATION=+